MTEVSMLERQIVKRDLLPFDDCECALCEHVREHPEPVPEPVKATMMWSAVLSWVILKGIERTIELWLGKPVAKVFGYVASLIW